RRGLEGSLRGCARFCQVERVQEIRERRDDVHRVVDDERRRFLSAIYAERESEGDTQRGGIRRIDLTELAVTATGVVLRGASPLSVVGLVVGNADRDVWLGGAGGADKLCVGGWTGGRRTLHTVLAPARGANYQHRDR